MSDGSLTRFLLRVMKGLFSSWKTKYVINPLSVETGQDADFLIDRAVG